MSATIGGIYQNGRVVLRKPVDWPDGVPVEVALVEPKPVKWGMTEDEWPTDAEGIAQWLKWYDSLEPLEFTPQEEADLAAWRKTMKENDIAKTPRRMEGLFE